jgi:hypothetical protein
VTTPHPRFSQPIEFSLDAVIGVGLNQLGERVGARALQWEIELPGSGVAAEFRGHAATMTPDEVHSALDSWTECLSLSERRDHDGIRENTGLMETRNWFQPVRLVVWGVINRAELKNE